jgi:hypothetical protein
LLGVLFECPLNRHPMNTRARLEQVKKAHGRGVAKTEA